MREQTIVGFTLGYIHSKFTCLINFLVVEDDYQGQGIGKKLLDAVKEELRTKNIKNFWLMTHGFNTKAQQFYTKYGIKTCEDIFKVYFQRV